MLNSREQCCDSGKKVWPGSGEEARLSNYFRNQQTYIKHICTVAYEFCCVLNILLLIFVGIDIKDWRMVSDERINKTLIQISDDVLVTI